LGLSGGTAIDTTVQEKAIAHPTDARLTHRAIEKLVELAKREGVELRQSYLRLAKRAAIMVGRYTHAHQFKRARRELKFLRTRLGRIIRDIRRKIEGNTALEDRFGPLLDLALRVRHQEQRQRGTKVYSLHAPEVECIGRGKARASYEFGCKVSIATPVTAPKGGQFVLHAKALHGNPYDWPHSRPRHRRSRKAYGCHGPPHPRRQRAIAALEGLQMRLKPPRRRVMAKLRDDPSNATGPNQVWAIDWMHDSMDAVCSHGRGHLEPDMPRHSRMSTGDCHGRDRCA
jgi:hypothetical protein